MAKQIKSSEIYEDDIFKNIRESAEKTIETINKINAEFKQTGEVLKKSIGGAKFDSAKSVNEFVKAQSQANKLQKEAIQLDKARIEAERQMAMATAASEKAEQQAIKTEREKLKLDQDLARQAERKAKAEEKAAKAARDESSAYKQLEKNTRELKNQSKELAAQMLVMERNGQKNSKAYRELASKYKEVTRAAQQGDAQLKKIDSTVGDNFRNVGNYKNAIGGLKNALGQLGLAFGIGTVVRGAFNVVKDFDQGMANLASVIGKSRGEIQALEEDAKRLGATTRFTATQVAEMQTEFAKLGFNDQEILNATESTLALAGATGTDLARATEVAGGTLRGFNLDSKEMQRVNDVMAKSFSTSALGMENFAESMKYVAPVANAAGMSIEETTAMLGKLADNGIKGSQAGTALRRIISEMAKTGKPTSEALKEIADAGITLTDAQDEVGRSAQTALLVLAKNMDGVDKLTKTYENAEGAAKEMADTQLNTIGGSLDLLTSAWEGYILGVNEASGAGAGFSTFIQFLANNLPLILGTLGKIVVAFGAYKAALLVIQAKQYLFNGGLKETIKGMGDVFKSAKKAGEGAKEMGTAVGNAGRSMSAIPWVAIIGAVIELATSFYDVASGAKRAREQAERLGNYQEKAQEVATENIKKQLDALGKLQSQRKRDYDLAIAQAKTEADKKKATEEYIKLREQDIAKTRDQLRTFKNEVLERKKGYNEQLKQAENIQKMQQSGSRSQEELAARMRQTLATELGLDPQFAKTLDIIDVLNAKLSASNVKIDEYGNTIIELNEDLKDLNSELQVNSVEHEDNTGKINAKIPKLKEHKKTMKEANDEIERMNSLMKETESLIDEIAAYEAEQNVQAAIKSQLDAISQSGKYSLSIINQTIDAEYKLQKAILDRIYLEAIENAKTEQEIINARTKYNFELQKLDQETADKRKEIREELETAQEDWIEKNRNNEIEANKEIVESDKEKAERRMEYFRLTTEYFKKQSDERIKQYEKEISKAEEQYNTLQELAKNGNINAKESLAEQQRIINEANAKKEKEQRRQARLQLLETAFSTYNQKVASGAKNPLAETIRDIGLLRAFIDTLPAYFDGTEDTGQNGNGVDGKGGFHAILHPNERVIPKSLNDKIGDLSNEQLTKLAMEYQNGKTIRGNEQIASAFDTMLLVQKIDELNSTIKNKPETNIELGEITQSAMNIVKSVKKGNTTIYNRYRIKP